ncbi:HEPN-associated N-terminal domain-containing protein [Roseateles sp. So40a]|uniref:HEPN-associated N-terminal domain-containing protein n=1 Tax=Roseateles sp. So40a TaxID=3400226 RepID=UPI003A868B21
MRVCASCFDDSDLRQFIREREDRRGCDFCKRFDAPTKSLEAVARHIEQCLLQHYGLAVDQLPYESAEGGYIGTTWDTGELLFDSVGLNLPRDHTDKLRWALLDELPDEPWCEFDWLVLNHDQALQSSWEDFCETVKHRRRFFFQATSTDGPDTFTPATLLSIIATTCESGGLIRMLPEGRRFWRARVDLPVGERGTAADFGPPPRQFATQTNRMNPAGVPMLYLASTLATALTEARAFEARVGQWVAARPLRVLDLRRLPDVPGIFSTASRQGRLALRFLRSFSEDIMKPVARDDRAHLDYLPSQVVTEFMRDFKFEDGPIDGIAYDSTIHPSGWNLALFAEPHHLGLGSEERDYPVQEDEEHWLRFVKSVRGKRQPPVA